jgi:replicative DNA helicase
MPIAGNVPAYPRRALLEALTRRVEQPMGATTKAAHPKPVTTEQIAATVRHPADGRANHAVVNARPLVLPHRADLALPPYTLGAWLASGASAAARFTAADPEIVAYVEADGFVVRPGGDPMAYTFSMEPLPELPERVCVVCGRWFLPRATEVTTCGLVCGGRSKAVPNRMAAALCADCGDPVTGRGSAGRRCATCHAGYGSAVGALRALGVLDNKHVPSTYLRASEQQRRQLLAGLLDTDGTVGADGSVRFAVMSRRLAHDVHELVLSLGYRCTVAAKPAQGRRPLSSTAYTLNFTTTDDVFRLERKRLVHKEHRRGTTPARAGVRYIVDVRPVPSVSVRCVTVDNADHLYLAGRTMIPTHNSTVSMDFARNAAVRHNMASAIFSLEMSKIEIVTRLLSAEARVPLHVLRSGQLSDDDWTRLARRMGEISEAPIFVDDTPNMTLMEIRAKARRMRQRNDLKLVVVDYLQLMSSPKRTESRQQEVAELSRGLKLLAKEIECPVIAVSQLNRGPEQRTDKRPQLSDLRESGSIEQDADVVILLHRDDYYDKESPRAGEADFIVAKHRNGPTDTVTVAAQLHFSRFVDMAIS